MKEYFEGVKLYGNDFSLDEIKNWYEEETEGYADLGSKDKKSYSYGYHMVNDIHGFNKLKNQSFENVLGFGSAWGYEFEPIIDKIKRITIIEPSDNLVNNKIGNLSPYYVKPVINGILTFDDNTFDLITCFGTLHHIPNVSVVLSELIRVLKPNGYLLLREPIISMGDWRKPRMGLTRNERGIPVSFFENEFAKYSLGVVSKGYCFTMTSLLQRNIGFLFNKPIYSYKTYVLLDKYISRLLKHNVKYHATKKINRISPQSIFYVLKKIK
ncbi:MAG: class I SAM-dependent methyltransferase [Cytophagales bacterium]|nr:MAG: class I SAM-dependent methyltransferase [Cytophagales bacterium]